MNLRFIKKQLITTLLFIGIFSSVPQSYLFQNEICLPICAVYASSSLTQQDIMALKKQISGADVDDKAALEARLKLARHYQLSQQPQKVIDQLRPAVDSLNVSGLRILAKAYSQKKEFLQVIRILENLIQRYKNDYVSYTRLGEAYFEIDNYEESANSYAKAVKINKRYRPAYDGLLKTLEESGKKYEFRNTLLDMIGAFGEKAELMNLLCKTYYTDGYLNDARKICQRAIQLSPKTADNHVYYGLSLESLKNSNRAIAIVKNAAKQYPQSEFAQFTAADMYQKNNNSLSAYKFFRKCTKADKKSSRCWLGLANMAFEVKNFKESLAAYKKSCDLDRSTAIQDFRNAATKLKLSNNLKWKDKFSSFALRCRYQTN